MKVRGRVLCGRHWSAVTTSHHLSPSYNHLFSIENGPPFINSEQNPAWGKAEEVRHASQNSDLAYLFAISCAIQKRYVESALCDACRTSSGGKDCQLVSIPYQEPESLKPLEG